MRYHFYVLESSIFFGGGLGTLQFYLKLLVSLLLSLCHIRRPLCLQEKEGGKGGMCNKHQGEVAANLALMRYMHEGAEMHLGCERYTKWYLVAV